MECLTCGNPQCSACHKPFTSPPLHVYWYECICDDCQGPPLSDEELAELFGEAEVGDEPA